MIKVKIRDIMLIEPVGKKLISYEWETPAKSYNVFKVIDAVFGQRQFFSSEKTKLFKKYGEQEGSTLKIKDEFVEQYKREIDSLLELEVEIPDVEFNLQDVMDSGYIDSELESEKINKLTPIDMYRIETFLNKVQEYAISDIRAEREGAK